MLINRGPSIDRYHSVSSQNSHAQPHLRAKFPRAFTKRLLFLIVISVLLSFLVPVILIFSIGGFDDESYANQNLIENFLNDSQCFLANSRPWPVPHKPQALAIFPKSGALWIRAMIERISGRTTTAAICQKKYKKWFSGECEDPRFSICTRSFANLGDTSTTNRMLDDTLESFHRVIVILRNPFDVLYSQYISTPQGRQDVQNYNNDSQNPFHIPFSYIETQVTSYKSFYSYWIRNSSIPRLEIKHEDLHNKPLETWGRAVYFLGVPVSDQRINCSLQPDESGMDFKKFVLRPYYSLPFFNARSYKYVIENLLDELCFMGYNDEEELTFDCEEQYKQIQIQRKQKLEKEESERYSATKAIQDLLHRQSNASVGKVTKKYWYEGLRMVKKSIQSEVHLIKDEIQSEVHLLKDEIKKFNMFTKDHEKKSKQVMEEIDNVDSIELGD